MSKFQSNNQDYFKPENINSFIELIEKEESKKLFNIVKDFHPSEIAYYIQAFSENHRKKFIATLANDFDPSILVELEPNFLEKIIDEFDLIVLSRAINELNSDDAASIINLLDLGRKNKILSKISSKNRISIEDNLSYKENSAGRLMQSEIVKIPIDLNVGHVIDFLRKKKKNLPEVFYDLFVIDSDDILVGTVTLSKVICSSRIKKISQIMKKNHESIHASIDQEEVADIFRKRNLTSLAVVNDKKKLLGVINVDDVVDVIDTEAEEDLLKLAGVGEQSFYGAILSISKARFTWLFFNLIAAFVAAYVIKNFEETIQKFALLAALMPVIASMGGCSGTQSLTTAVRAIAMKQLTWSNAFRSTGKEVLVGFLNGFIFSLGSFIITFFWFDDFKLSFVIAISLLLNLIFGSFFGAFIPIMLSRFGIDPAFASGAFVITLTDIIGFLMFLTLASIYLI